MTRLLIDMGGAPSATPPYRRRREHSAWNRIGPRPNVSDALRVLPSLPRPVLSRLVANLIDHIDEQDGDADCEPDGTEQEDDNEDCCTAGDDRGTEWRTI